MADITISDLTGQAPTLANSVFPFSTTGVSPSTYKATLAQIKSGLALSQSDITTALGYTPYNSTNPNGYITSSSLPDAAALARAWVTFNGHGTVGQNQTTYRSYNVTRVVRDSTYNYTIYFTNSMPGTNYAFAGVGCSVGITPSVRENASPQTINSCLTDRLLITTGTGGSSYTGSYLSIIVFA